MKIGEDVFIKTGITDFQIDQLINYSHTDSEVVKFTSDPDRFKDRASFNAWLQKGRVVYTLVDANQNLLGIIWFGPKELESYPQNNFTFAIRTYSHARGQGLSFPFMELAFKEFLSKNFQVKGFWLETSANNAAAIHTYQKFGFETINYPAEASRIYMLKNI